MSCLDDPCAASFKILLDLVLPESQDLPAGRPQVFRYGSISVAVALDLLTPERSEFMCPPVEIVSMPEITIEENGQLGTIEGEVRAAPHLLRVLGRPMTALPKFASDLALDKGSAPLNARHERATLFGAHHVGQLESLHE